MDLLKIEPRNTHRSQVGHDQPTQDLWNPHRRQAHAHVIRDVEPEKQHIRDARAPLVGASGSLPGPELAVALTTPGQLEFRRLRSMVARFLATTPNIRA